MPSALQNVLDKYGGNIVKLMKNRLMSGNKFATGNLINSLTYKYSYSNGQYNLQITGAKYLINVDRGRRAGARMPPINPIIAWLKVKRINVNVPKEGSREAALRGRAYAVAKNISKKGIKPFPILRIGQIVSASNKFKEDIARAIIQDTVKVLNLK